MVRSPVLVSIPVSHYAEKARWALDRAGISYTEEGHVAGLHVWAVRRRGGQRTVPLLVTATGSLTDSTDILRWVDAQMPAHARLFGDDAVGVEAARLETLYDEKLGPSVRRSAYGALLPHPELIREILTSRVSRVEAMVGRATFPALLQLIVKNYRITPDGIAKSNARVLEIFDQTAALLADGRPFIAGDRFSAADLAFCGLAAPLLLVPEYGGPLPAPERIPAALRERVRPFTDHPAGQYVFRMYREQRRTLVG